MTNAVLPFDVETLSLRSAIAKEVGEQNAAAYQGREPYPYGLFDNFLPEDVSGAVLLHGDMVGLAQGPHDPFQTAPRHKGQA
ncbi:MAG: hypothetical protein P1U72_12620 [Paracoccaceae bacterium]|jgi:hypothetical protein|nr:hypothetical protein [Paracoccaceae bacterium]